MGTPKRINGARFGVPGDVCRRCYQWLYATRVPLGDTGDADYVADWRALVEEARRRFPVPWFTAWADARLAGKPTTPDVIIEQAQAVAFAALDAGNIALAEGWCVMSDHVHLWVLPPPNGPTSRGACACGATRGGMLNAWLGDYTPDELARLLQKPRERKRLVMAVTPRQR